jgi:hypothetical protein
MLTLSVKDLLRVTLVYFKFRWYFLTVVFHVLPLECPFIPLSFERRSGLPSFALLKYVFDKNALFYYLVYPFYPFAVNP